jgi:hypothetical protein
MSNQFKDNNTPAHLPAHLYKRPQYLASRKKPPNVRRARIQLGNNWFDITGVTGGLTQLQQHNHMTEATITEECDSSNDEGTLWVNAAAHVTWLGRVDILYIDVPALLRRIAHDYVQGVI